MEKVLIGTPSHDGRLDVWFVNSLVNTIKLAPSKNYHVDPVYTSFDSLIQRARNSLFKIAVEENYDYLFFIDSDAEWNPEVFFELLNMEEDVIGAPTIKKDDKIESYNCKLLNKKLIFNKNRALIKVDGIGTGFMKLSRKAFLDLWNCSEEYQNETSTVSTPDRMVCNVEVKNGVLVSEDYIICEKLKSFGYDIWVNPYTTINHIGNKKYKGHFENFITKLGYS